MADDKDKIDVDMGSEGTKRLRMDFPSNSHKKKNEEKEEKQEKKVEKIISGTVIKRKKSFGKRFMETFVGEDIDSVGSYIIHDVLIPAAKSAINDMVQGGIEMILFGERRGSRTSRDRGKSYVSYNSISSDRRRDDRRGPVNRNKARHNFDDIVLDTRGEAEEVLSNLVDLTIDYGQATVADLYDLVGVKEDYTDRKYGWTDLSSSSVSRVRDGYLINLPRPILLD